MSVNERVRFMKVAMKEFRIPHPRLENAQRRLQDLRAVGNRSRRKPQQILSILGPTYSGKSTIIRDLIEQVTENERPEPGRHPILHVTLSAQATIKGLGADIIGALEENGLPEQVLAELVGNARAKKWRKADVTADISQSRVMRVATRLVELAGVELLVIDEIHHFVHSDGAKKTAWSVSEELKKFAIAGVCPLVVVGIGEARRILSRQNNNQFVSRCQPPILLDPLDLEVPEEASMFVNYAKALDHKLVQAGIFERPSGLDAGDGVGKLYDISAGVIGTVSNLVEVAAELAIRREGPAIEPEDLCKAADTWAIPLGYVDRNPWTHGPRELKRMRLVRKALSAA